jgi:hypothetical protein
VPLFPIIDMASMKPESSGGGYKTEFVGLEGEAGGVLPGFTSANRCKCFVDGYFARDGITQPSTFPMDVFRLAAMIEPWIETGGLGFLVFDPLALSPGKWSSPREPIPAAHYCRFVSEIGPGIDQTVRESEARFGTHVPGSVSEKEAMRRLMPRLERLADSAGVRVDEWWEGRDARE